MKTTQPTAADTFNAAREQALEDAMDVAFRLETFCEDLRIDWGHAGTMSDIAAKLAEIAQTLAAVDPR